MGSKKLQKKIRDWATSLGFRLSDESRPAADYFALLTATPNRRHLWETIVESVSTRQKVENIRNRIAYANLVHGSLESESSFLQQVSDKCGWLKKEHDLENMGKEKSIKVMALEENIMTKTSDLIFEICKLTKLEKQYEELNDKLLILKLFLKKYKKMIKELENKLLKINCIFYLESGLQNLEGSFTFSAIDLLITETCNCSSLDGHDCPLFKRIQEIHKSGVPEHFLWEEVAKHKKNLLQHFYDFLVQLNSSEKDIFSEKGVEIEKKINQLVAQLKQKITADSLQVMINSTKGKYLESEELKLEERLMLKEPQDGTLNESDFEKCKRSNLLRSYTDMVALKNYREFLKEKLSLLEDEELIMGRKHSLGEESKVQFILHNFASIVDEIKSNKYEEKEVEERIVDNHKKLESLHQFLKEETEELKQMNLLEETAEKLKFSSQKQIYVFMDIPVDAFRTLESSSGRIFFECESERHWLENYDGPSREFFGTMLIPPLSDFQQIISAISNRKVILNEMKKFILNRNNLTSLERKIYDRVNSINYDSQLSEKNFKTSDGILWSITSKSKQLLEEIDLVEKLLKNWVEQPYRMMVMPSLERKS